MLCSCNFTYLSVLVDDVNLSEFLRGFGAFEFLGLPTVSFRCPALFHSDIRF